MSLVHGLSSEAVTSALDLFSVPPSLGVLESGHWLEFTPISTYTNNTAPLEFHISGNSEHYLDLTNSYLQLRAKIVKGDGSAIADATKVGPVNLWMQSLFSQVDVYFNDRQVSGGSNTYPYRAYIEKLLSYDAQTKKTQLGTELYDKDVGEKMEVTDPSDLGGNTGLTNRTKFVKGGKAVDLLGRLHCDIFYQEKYLLNGVDVKIKLTRSKPEFSLISGEDDPNFMVIFEQASLFIRQVAPSSSLLMAHAKAMEKGNAKYPIRRCDVKTVSISRGMSSLAQDHLFLGNLPKRLILGLVNNSAFNGNYTKNPFNFVHCNLNFLCLYLNGVQVPLKPLQPNYPQDQYMRCYISLFAGTGMLFDNRSHDITREDYKNGYTLYAFDLTPTLENGDYFNLQREGSLRLEMKFSKPLAEVVNVVIYSEHESILEIDKARNVYVDY